MQEKDTAALVKQMRDAFGKSGVDLSEDKIREVIEKEDCGSCWNVGCKDGCSSGCLSACKSGNK